MYFQVQFIRFLGIQFPLTSSLQYLSQVFHLARILCMHNLQFMSFFTFFSEIMRLQILVMLLPTKKYACLIFELSGILAKWQCWTLTSLMRSHCGRLCHDSAFLINLSMLLERSCQTHFVVKLVNFNQPRASKCIQAVLCRSGFFLLEVLPTS